MADMESFIPPPTAAANVPFAEKTGGAVGADSSQFARADHQHPRMTSSTPVLLDGAGAGVATFTRSFPVAPIPSFAQIPPSDGATVTGPPCVFRVKSWIKTGSDFTGANIEGFMLSPPTGLASVNVLGISVAIGGQTYVTFGPAATVNVSVIMLPNSTP